MGFGGGSSGGGGGGGRGRFHASSNTTSQSHPKTVLGDLGSQINVTHAAVTSSRIHGSQSEGSFIGATKPNSKWDCKMLVSYFEMCGINHSHDGGKNNSYCQSFKQDLEKYCAKFKPYWNDWWTNELKAQGYKWYMGSYNHCVETVGTKEYPGCVLLLKRINEHLAP